MIATEIPGWMSEVELGWLAEQAKRMNIIVEVGSYQGRSTRALGENVKGCVFAVDDWKGLRTVDKAWWESSTPADERKMLFKRFRWHLLDLLAFGKVIPVHANHSAVPHLPIPDMVFIDGDHSYEGVKRDIETWLPRLRSGGLLCGHDYGQEALTQAVHELLPGASSAVDLIWQWVKP